MNALVDYLAEHGGRLAIGATALLVCGAVAICFSRSPVRRLRLGELTLLVTLVWPAVASVPLPAFEWPGEAGFKFTVEEHATHDTAFGHSPSMAASSVASALPARAIAGEGPSTGAPLAPLFAFAFVIGAGLRIVWLLAGLFSLGSLLRRARPAPGRVTALAHALDAALANRVRIVASADTDRPFCAALPHAVIVLPLEFCRAASADALRAVLLHERAHLRGGDLRTERLFAFASPLLYWNPLFWWLHRRVRQASEVLADDVATQEIEKPIYVRALIRIAERSLTHRRTPVAALSAIELETDFHRRMKMLIRRRAPLESRSSRGHVLARHLVAVLLLAGAGMAFGIPTTPTTDGSASKEAQAESAPRYFIRFEYADERALGQFVTRLVTRGLPVEVTAIAAPNASAQSWHCELAVRSTDEEFTHTLSGIVGGVVEVTSLRMKRDKPDLGDIPVTIVAKDMDIRAFVDHVAETAKLNVLLAPEVQGTVTLRFEDVPWRAALNAATSALGFVVVDEPGGVVVIDLPR